MLDVVQLDTVQLPGRHAVRVDRTRDSLLTDFGRATLDDRSEKVNLKIREAQLQKVPYMLVVGGREAENGTVSVRNRKHGDQGVKSFEEFMTTLRQQIDSKTTVE